MVWSGADALLQSIELAVAAEEAGADGAYYRVHHFAQQLASPFPLLAAAAARTSRIELGTAVIDMRYENPLYMAEDAGTAPRGRIHPAGQPTAARSMRPSEPRTGPSAARNCVGAHGL